MAARSPIVAALLLLCGCLGDLVPPAGEDGGPLGDGGPDARLVDAGDTVDLPDDLAVRNTSLVRDLNDNGYPDLVLLNDPADQADRGVLVFHDRADGFFELPDQVLSTETLHPLVATAEDVIGDSALDLLVVARDDSMDPYVILFEGRPGSRFEYRATRGFPPYDIDGGSVEAPEPVFAAAVRVRGSQHRDLVFGDLGTAVVLAPDSWESLPEAVPFTVEPSSSMNAAAAVPSAEAGREDLFIVDNQGAFWLHNNGTAGGGFLAGPDTWSAAWDPNARAFFFFDLQPDGVPDFMTLDQMLLDVGVVAKDDPGLAVARLDTPLAFGDSYGEALFATEVDGIAGVDLLILDDDPTGEGDARFGVLAARNVKVDETVHPTSGRIDSDSTHLGNRTRMVAGDFDHDGVTEVWVFDPALEKTCLVGEVYDFDHYRFNECT